MRCFAAEECNRAKEKMDKIIALQKKIAKDVMMATGGKPPLLLRMGFPGLHYTYKFIQKEMMF